MRADFATLLLCLVILAHAYAGRVPSYRGTTLVAVVINVLAFVIVLAGVAATWMR